MCNEHWKDYFDMKFLLQVVTCIILASPAIAEDVKRFSQHGDWEVFVDSELCWASTFPALDRSVYKRGGKIIDTPNRGDKKYIAFTVAFQKGKSPRPEVAYSAGKFEFSTKSANANLFRLVVKGSNIKDKSFVLAAVNQSDMGWAYPVIEQEPEIVDLLKKGANATVTVVSTRGTVISDTMSLIGITAAVNEAQRECTTK